MLKKQPVVEGDLDLSKDDVIWDINTEIIKGNCTLTNIPKGVYPFPKLKKIFGNLDLRNSGVLFLPKLKEVGGDVLIDQDTQLLDFGSLQKIGGNVFIKDNERLEKLFNKKFKKAGHKYIRSDIQEESVKLQNL